MKKDFVLLLFCMLVGGLILNFRYDQFPGGIHYENYAFYIWNAAEQSHRISHEDILHLFPNGTPGCYVYYLLISIFQKLTGIYLNVEGIVRFTGSISTMSVGLTYILARLCGSRRSAILAVVFLLSCPGFLIQTRCGNISPTVHTFLTIPPLICILLAHRYRKPWFLIISGFFLSWSYLGLYSSFPLLLGGITLFLLVGYWKFHDNMLPIKSYTAFFLSIPAWILLNSVVMSLFIFHKGPLDVLLTNDGDGYGYLQTFRKMFHHSDGVGLTPLPFQPKYLFNNLYNLIHEFFIRSGPTYKSYIPKYPPADLPFDHMGASLPGVPSVSPLVSILAILGCFRIRNRFDLLLPLAMIVTTILILSLFISYHGRRIILIVPLLSIFASTGFIWMEERYFKNRRRLQSLCQFAIPGLMLCRAMYDFAYDYPHYISTVQFNSYKVAGKYIEENLNPQKDVLVLLDKSTFFPAALSMETHFKPYSILVMSEFFFPILVYEYPYLPDKKTGPYTCDVSGIKPLLLYCNSAFPPGQLVFTTGIDEQHMAQFKTTLKKQILSGKELYFLASFTNNQFIESGSQYLQQCLMDQLHRHGFELERKTAFGILPEEPDIIIFKLKNPELMTHP